MLLISLGFPVAGVANALHPIPSVSLTCADTLAGHEQCGMLVGKTFRERIAQAFTADTTLHNLYSAVLTDPGLGRVFAALVSTNAVRYPLYMAEINGTARGSGQPLDLLLLANLRLEVATAALGNKSNTSEHVEVPDSCTDLLIKDGWTHNEDYGTLFFDAMYMVNMTLQRDQGEDESFVSFAYPGVLPGWAPGWNSHHIAVSWNVLYPRGMRPGGGVGVAFVCRDVLTARTVDEALNLAAPADLALGQNLNVGSFVEPFSVTTMETAPGGLRSIVAIEKESPSFAYFHANEYLRLPQHQIASNIISSQHRRAVYSSSAPRPDSIASMLHLLGNTADAAFPIFRRNDSTREDTLFTIAFDLLSGTVTCYRANPRLGEQAVLWRKHVAIRR